MVRCGGWGTIFRLLGIPSKNNWWDKLWKVHTLQRRLVDFRRKKKKKKKGSEIYGAGWLSREHFQTFRYPS